MNKRNAKKEIYFGNLDEIINYLRDCQRNGENCYIDYETKNGAIRLYSADIDYNNAYLRIYGLTKFQKDSIDKRLYEAFTTNDDETKYEIISLANSLKEENIANIKSKAHSMNVEIKSLDHAIEILKECRKRGINSYIDFNGCILYSIDINSDNAYMEVVGLTEMQYKENRSKYHAAKTQKEKDSIIKEFYQMIEENKKVKTMK